MLTLRRLFLGLVVCAAGVAGANAKAFELIRSVDKVGKVDLDAPFLFVVITSDRDFKAVVEKVESLIEAEADPDVAALEERYTLRCVDAEAYRLMKEDLRRVKKADTVKELRLLYLRAVIAYEYELDWTVDNPVVRRTAYSRDRRFVGRLALDDPGDAIGRYVATLRARELKPDKVIGIATMVGRSHFPVFGDEILAGGVQLPYEEFRSILERDRIE